MVCEVGADPRHNAWFSQPLTKWPMLHQRVQHSAGWEREGSGTRFIPYDTLKIQQPHMRWCPPQKLFTHAGGEILALLSPVAPLYCFEGSQILSFDSLNAHLRAP